MENIRLCMISSDIYLYTYIFFPDFSVCVEDSKYMSESEDDYYF